MSAETGPGGPAARRVRELGHHAHPCHLYATREERAEVASELLAARLSAGDRCLYLGGEDARETVAAALAARGVDVAAATQRGALELTSSGKSFLAALRGPEDLGPAVNRAVDAALSAGFAGMTLAGDMGEPYQDPAGAGALVEAEALLQAIFAARPVVGICQFDATAIPPEVLLAVLRTHALVVHGGRVLRNAHVLPAAAALGRESPADELRRQLAILHERERADEALRAAQRASAEREAQYRAAFEAAGHVYWEVHGPTGEMLSGDPATVIGHSPGEVSGRALWFERVHPDDRAVSAAAWAAFVEGRSPKLSVEFRALAKDGSYRSVLARGGVVTRGPDGGPERVCGTVTDVTELKRLREVAEAADRLGTVVTLAGGVAHEVNNPLAYLTANVGWVDEGLARLEAGDPGAPRPAELRQALREALEGAARVRGIIRGLRQFARPGRVGRRERADVTAQLHAAVDLVRNEVSQRARLEVDLPRELPPVIADEGDIGQVAVNLLMNAAQAIPEGRAEARVRLRARALEGSVRFEVSDTGVGIAPADLPRIFDPFFTTRPVGAGPGLGLPVCQGIVSGLGGRIEVESEPGRGTTFRVTLPVAPALTPPPGALPATQRARVLVLDDEPLVARSLARLLSPAHDVVALTSPAEALHRIEAGERFDVLLCDLMMPELSGMDVEARLAEVAPAMVERTVYLTGGAFTERSRAFLAAGRPYLEKPVEAAELRARVEERIRRSADRAGS